MKIDTNLLILSALVLSLILNLIQYLRQHSRKKIGEGDIVLYSESGNRDTSQRNMITSVLNVIPSHNTAIIRVEGTQMVVSQKYLTKIPIDKAFPIRVPGTPCALIHNSKKSREHTREHGFVDMPDFTRDVFEGDELEDDEGLCSFGNKAKFFDVPIHHFSYSIGFKQMLREGKVLNTLTAH